MQSSRGEEWGEIVVAILLLPLRTKGFWAEKEGLWGTGVGGLTSQPPRQART